MTAQKTILNKFDSMKTLPHVAMKLTRLIADENTSMHKFEEIIRMDPTLVLRLLRVVNSPYYGLRQKIDSISRAVVFVGQKNLRNMVINEALKEIFKDTDENSKFSRSRLWLHSAAVGICSQMVSERIFGKKGDDAYLGGLLHDIGIILEDQVEPENFRGILSAYDETPTDLTEIERSFLSTDHCAIGYEIASRWKLPVEVAVGIRDHHKLDKIDPLSICGIIQASDYIASNMNLEAYPGMKKEIPLSIKSFIKENLEEFKTVARDLPGEVEKARSIFEF